MEQFKLEIKIDKVLSVNNYLAPRKKKVGLSKYILFLSLTTEAVKYKDDIYNHLVKEYTEYIKENIDEINSFFNNDRYKTIVTYKLNKNRIHKSDLTNMKKMCEDTIVKFIRSFDINYDDKMVYESLERKEESEDENEYIYFSFHKF